MGERIDYKKLGFRCGIEIHQQLAGKKLFCNCDAIIRRDEPDFTIERELRAAAGETGEVDQAAAYEQKKAKKFIYQGYEDTTCLVEADDDPPHPINQDALKTALQVAKALNMAIPDEIQVMRKTVVDGSNTSGFQRTALVGMNGYIKINNKKIGIPTLCLEEEACQIVERKKDYDIYNLSRLGIPLLEVATDSSISSPEECKEVAAYLGMILRSTGKCMRGIGSIRQDVNVSIKKGARTEIKGFQELKSIPKVIEFEIKRQLKEKNVKESVRKTEPNLTTSYLRPMPGADRMYPETDIETIIPDTKNIKTLKLIADEQKSLAKKYHLPEELIKQVIKDNIDLEPYIKKYSKIKPLFITEFFTTRPKEMRKRHNIEYNPEDFADEIFTHLNKSEIPYQAVEEIIIKLSKKEKINYAKYKGISDKEIEKTLKELIKKDPDAPIGALMGRAMAKFHGKADGKKVMGLLKKLK
jgi:Glu-tRNA(Gln) amidotransferase subunit E-like FAD-binding protein